MQANLIGGTETRDSSLEMVLLLNGWEAEMKSAS